MLKLPLLIVCVFAGSIFAAAQTPSTTETKQPVKIEVNAAHATGAYQPIWNYFGADEPNFTYAPNGSKLLKELAALSPAPVYIRVHNLLTTGNGEGSLKWGSTNAYREDAKGNPIYDWTITDRIFDNFRDTGVRPLVEVGFMPEALSTHPEPYRHNFPKGDVFTGWSYPPKDYGKWSALVTAWATHLRDRYGKAAVNGWLWEVWNEPDIPYWHGTPEEYFKLYDVTAAAIRKALPEAKIGGPESTGPYGGKSSAFLRQFLEHCAHGKNAATGGTGAPLDFISFHPKGSPKVVDGHVQMSVAHQLDAVDRGMKIVASFPRYKDTPIIMGESDPEGCAACKGPQNGYRNGPLYGVSIAEATARTYELARQDGVNIQGSVTWAFEFENQPYFAGFRSLATNGIDKPVLNVFRMWGMLRGQWLPVTSSGAVPLQQILAQSVTASPDVNAVATRADHEVDVLVWNYHDDDVPAPSAPVQLRVAGLAARQVRVEQFRMDGQHSNAYTAWQKMGSPQHPTTKQYAELEKAGKLQRMKAAQTIKPEQGTAQMHFDLPRQGVALVKMTW
ncbi:MAG: GH39 family glycosyl hydrolase [Acidobacteriaceae bacterium]